MKKIKAFLLNVLTSSITLLILFIIIEICLRLFSNQDQYTTSSYPVEMLTRSSITGMKPNFKGGFSLGEFDASIHINEIGIRDNTINKNEKRHKVLFLGDSFTFGHGIELK